MTEPAPFRPLALADLFALDLPEPEWVVEGVVPLGAATLLDAREKAGKGLLTIDLCACVALGEPFLDRAVKEGPAIYCAAEEHTRDVRERIAARIGAERAAPLYVLPLNGSTDDRLDLADPEGMQRLHDMLAAERPAVVVLDTLRELHHHAEDSSDDMGPLLRPLRWLAHTFNVALVVNHHQNKGGGSRGSTAIRAAFDQTLSFRRPEHEPDDGPPSGTLRVEGRYGPRFALPIRLGDGLRWEPAAPTLAPVEPDARGRVVAWVRDHDREGGHTAHEIAAALEIKPKTVQNVLSAIGKEAAAPLVPASGSGHKHGARGWRHVAPPLPLGTDPDAPPTIPPDACPLSGPGRKEQSAPPPLFVPDASRNNGNNAGINGRGCLDCGCLDCGAPLPDGAVYYCGRHGGGFDSAREGSHHAD